MGPMRYRAAGSATGNECSITAWIREKMALLPLRARRSRWPSLFRPTNGCGVLFGDLAVRSDGLGIVRGCSSRSNFVFNELHISKPRTMRGFALPANQHCAQPDSE